MNSTLKKIARLILKPTREKSASLIRLTFRPAQPPTSTIEFELSSDDAMYLLAGLQMVQAKNGWRVPRFVGSVRKPDLRIVKDE
jgi:hypothetical protein